MKRKMNLLGFLLVFTMLLSACGNTTDKNTESTEKMETVEIDNITYIEKDAHFEITDAKFADNTYVDGETLDWTSWEKVDKEILIKNSVGVYIDTKAKGGYTKENIEATYITRSDEWSHIAIGESRFGIYVRNEELDNAMVEIVEETESSESETVSEDVNNTTYTVTDMTKTMYAKQSVNVRSGPSSDYEKIGSLTTNKEVTVTGIADTGWYRISYNGGVAFVSNNYLSDTKVEVNIPSNNGGNTNENENNSVETNPPTNIEDELEKEWENLVNPETPEQKYTVDEVISIVRSTLESNGIMWYPDVFPNSEYGPSGGMSWGMDWVPMDDPQTYANGMAEGFQYNGFNLYYIEYLYTENGCVVLKTHYGDLPKE